MRYGTYLELNKRSFRIVIKGPLADNFSKANDETKKIKADINIIVKNSKYLISTKNIFIRIQQIIIIDVHNVVWIKELIYSVNEQCEVRRDKAHEIGEVIITLNSNDRATPVSLNRIKKG